MGHMRNPSMARRPFRDPEMRVKTFPIYFFLFTTPLSVCSIVIPKIETILAPLCLVITIICYCLSCKKIQRKHGAQVQNNVLKFYFLPMLLSLFGACAVLVIRNDSFYYDWFGADLPVRIAHMVIFLIILLLASQIINIYKTSIPDQTKFLASYAYGIFVILGIFGIWQIISSLTGIWCPDVGTRGHLYFSSSLNVQRVTSLANEPSYLVPFLLDAFFIFLFLKKQKIAWLLIGLVLFSLSFAGYMELFILAISALLLSDSKHKVKIIAGLVFVLSILFVVFSDVIDLVFEIM